MALVRLSRGRNNEGKMLPENLKDIQELEYI